MTRIKQSLREIAFKTFVETFSPSGGGGGGGFTVPDLTVQVYLTSGGGYTIPTGYRGIVNLGMYRYRTENNGYNYLYVKNSGILWIVSGCDDSAGGPSDSDWRVMGIEGMKLLAGDSVMGHGVTALIELYAV